MDILGVSLLVGLAFGRAGCLLNGCCYGGRCDAHWPLAMQFPMYSEPLVKLDGRANPFSQSTASPSPPYAKQLELGLLVPDERLMTPGMVNQPLPPAELHGRLDADQLAVMFGSRERAKELYDVAAGADGRLSRTEWDKDLAEPGGLLAGGELWQGVTPFGAGLDGQVDFRQVWSYLQRHRQEMLVRFDRDGDGALTGPQRDEANAYLQADQIALARATKSLPLKPAQALGIVNALLLAGILLAFYRLRRREGQVFALLLILYPITRFVLESIRADNPHDLALGILTHNQYTSLATIVVGAVLMLALAKMRPHAAIVAAGSGGSSSRPVRGRSAGHVKSRNRISQRPERAKEQK
jgi:phosphatidylglycerol:prolipoprotein diacylglycerol transferase